MLKHVSGWFLYVFINSPVRWWPGARRRPRDLHFSDEATVSHTSGDQGRRGERAGGIRDDVVPLRQACSIFHAWVFCDVFNASCGFRVSQLNFHAFPALVTLLVSKRREVGRDFPQKTNGSLAMAVQSLQGRKSFWQCPAFPFGICIFFCTGCKGGSNKAQAAVWCCNPASPVLRNYSDLDTVASCIFQSQSRAASQQSYVPVFEGFTSQGSAPEIHRRSEGGEPWQFHKAMTTDSNEMSLAIFQCGHCQRFGRISSAFLLLLFFLPVPNLRPGQYSHGLLEPDPWPYPPV